MLSLVLLLAAAVATPQSARVSVYASAPIRDGFVDTNKEIQDSIKDLPSMGNQLPAAATKNRLPSVGATMRRVPPSGDLRKLAIDRARPLWPAFARLEDAHLCLSGRQALAWIADPNSHGSVIPRRDRILRTVL